MTAADLTVLVLPPTSTYARREAVWLPTGPGCGVLQIKLQHGRRGNRRKPVAVEVDTYGVLEMVLEATPHGRVFLLENLSDPDPDGPFECVVGGMAETCGCEMGRIDLRRPEPTGCKHRSALLALLNEGLI